MVKVVLKKFDESKIDVSNKLSEANELYKKGKYKAAAKLYSDILKLKFNPEAACCLGKCCLYGRGVARNTKEAYDLFTKASIAGYYPAYYYLAKYLEINVERINIMSLNAISQAASYARNKNEMMSLFKKAADKGHIESCYKLGQCFSYLPNPVSDPLYKSIEWYKKAADKGHVKAMYDLGFIYRNGNQFDIKKDYAKAAIWYEKAAKKGYVKAMLDLSWCYARGKGVKKDKMKALYWRKKAKSNKAAYNKTRNLKYGDTIVNIKTGEEEMIILKCQCDSNIQCAVSTGSEENGYIVNSFGSHTYTRSRQNFPHKGCIANIPAEKAFADKFPQKEWEFK